MIINEVLFLTLAILAGVCVGAFFFAGLWWTVLKGVQTPRQGLVFVLSFLLRTTVALAAFFFIGRGHPDRVGACLIGFIVGRGLVIRTIGLAQRKRSVLALPTSIQRKESEDASPTSRASGGASRENTDAPES